MTATPSGIRILLTGSSGFLGSHIVQALATRHPTWTLHCLDLHVPSGPQSAEFHHTDLTDADAIDHLISTLQPDAIVHTAGLIPSGAARYNPSPSLRSAVHAVNVLGTCTLLVAARKHGVRTFVYTSSCTVFVDDLDNGYPLMRETDPAPPAGRLLLYGASKAQAERAVLDANESTPGGMRTCALRPALIIGPGDRSGTLATIWSLVAAGQTGFVIGDGDNLVDFVDVENVAEAHVLAVENLLGVGRFVDPELRSDAAGLAIFISNNEPIYFRDFMKAVWAQVGGHVPKYEVTIPARLAWWFGAAAEVFGWVMGQELALSRGSVRDAVLTRYSAGDRAKEVLNYAPRIGLSEAVRRACDDFRSQLRLGEDQTRKNS